MKRIILNKRLLFSICLFCAFLDQVAKLFIFSILSETQSYEIIPGIINFTLVRNYGAAFSLFTGIPYILSITSLLVSSALFLLLLNKKSELKPYDIGLALILGGSLGNGIDRWTLGYVKDFIDIIAINFPIFNIADIVINLGVFCIILDTIWKSNPKY